MPPSALRRFFAAAAAAAAASYVVHATPTNTTCTHGTTIAHSNRDAAAPCAGAVGDVCEYTCDPGYIPIGRHVCVDDGHYTNATYIGGRCAAVCEGVAGGACPAGRVPLRSNVSSTTASGGSCLRTLCVTEDAALQNIARGAHAAWRMAVDARTGIATGTVSPGTGAVNPAQGRVSMTGIAAQVDAMAVAMGWDERAAAQRRLLLSLKTLAGETEGFTPRRTRGFYTSFFDRATGVSNADAVDPMDAGLGMAALLSAAAFHLNADPNSDITREIVNRTRGLYASMDWPRLLCKNGVVNATAGDEVPFLFKTADQGRTCQGLNAPQRDGYYHYNEEMTSVWLAWESCAPRNGRCTAAQSPEAGAALERMWRAWQGRKTRPIDTYEGTPLLSPWSGYIVQLVYYTTGPFANDPEWTRYLRTHYTADKQFYGDTPEGGLRGRYGLGAGPAPAWCAGGKAYIADRLNHAGGNWCYTYSPYVVAGYMPVAQEEVRRALLDLMADGEAVQPVVNTRDATSGAFKFDPAAQKWVPASDAPLHVLTRRAARDPGWAQDHLTMVDFASELWGLATLWLPGGAGWFAKYTDTAHIIHGGVPPSRVG